MVKVLYTSKLIYFHIGLMTWISLSNCIVERGSDLVLFEVKSLLNHYSIALVSCPSSKELSLGISHDTSLSFNLPSKPVK